MNTEKKFIVLTWEDFGRLVNILIEKIKDANVFFDGVYGIPRGGLPLAVILSHHFNIPLLVYPTDKSLVVDDISDKGITLSNVKHKLIATIFSTSWTKIVPDCYVEMKVDKNSHIVFPWENIDREGR